MWNFIFGGPPPLKKKKKLFTDNKAKYSKARVTGILWEYSNNKRFKNKPTKNGRKPVTSSRDEKKLKKGCEEISISKYEILAEKRERSEY